MARIFCGVMGDARGHVMRARCLAESMPDHQFLFAGGGHVAELGAAGLRTVGLPLVATRYARGRVDLLATALAALRVLASTQRVVARLAAALRDFDPDLILTDYEFFTPLAARRLGRRTVSLDHQHVLTHGVCPAPGQASPLGRLLTLGLMRTLFATADHYLLTSFFTLPVRDASRAELFGPLIRPSVQRLNPRDGEHILVYQTTPRFAAVLPALERQPRPVRLYGLEKQPASPHTEFRPFSDQGFLSDLASCAYVVCNGSHGLISEALHLGKPVVAIPIRLAYEQEVNADQLARLGFGERWSAAEATAEAVARLESRLDGYRARIRAGRLLDNARLVARLEQLAQERGPAYQRPPAARGEMSAG